MNKDVSEVLTFGAEAFTSEAYARAEADKLWPKVWQAACRLEDIPSVGDYVTYDIMDDTIVVVRAAADKINAFFNVCQHRGRRLVDGCGNIKQFFCKYHAWRYDLNGANIFVLDKDDWGGALTQDRLNLVPVKVDTWGGWVWINMDPNCGPLREHLEPWATVLEPFHLENMRYRWRYWCYFDCNWKVALEAFIESYHVTGTHPQLVPLADWHMWSKAQGLHGNTGFKERNAKLNVAESNTINRAGKGDDPRTSTAKLQREIMDTTNARTTDTLVRAAERLVDELPPGTPAGQVMSHWLESARRDDAARGVIWPTVDPAHAAQAGSTWHIFPNLQVGHSITNALSYRTRPHGSDPNKCIFEACVIELFPAGQEPRTQWEYVDPSDIAKWRPVLPQDFGNMVEVQKGMRSRGFHGTLPNPEQERTVTNFHRNLARYMGTSAPQPLK